MEPERAIDKMVFAYKAEIFMGGDLDEAIYACRDYCARGLCVTVTPTTYAFTGGTCEGVIVGLINYGRFPTHDYMEIWEQAYSLAMFLKERLGKVHLLCRTTTVLTFIQHDRKMWEIYYEKHYCNHGRANCWHGCMGTPASR